MAPPLLVVTGLESTPRPLLVLTGGTVWAELIKVAEVKVGWLWRLVEGCLREVGGAMLVGLATRERLSITEGLCVILAAGRSKTQAQTSPINTECCQLN